MLTDREKAIILVQIGKEIIFKYPKYSDRFDQKLGEKYRLITKDYNSCYVNILRLMGYGKKNWHIATYKFWKDLRKE